MSTPAQKSLGHIRVLDFSQWTAGPLCAQILGDLGADVIKIERPGGTDDRRAPPYVSGYGVYHALNNRDKRNITLNIKTPEGRELFRQLIEKSDVLIENFRPGFLESQNLGYADLVKWRPGLILASVTGYGSTGPYRERGGYDMIAQAIGGLMSLNGEPGHPPLKMGTSMTAVVAGLNTAIGVLAALQHREHTGEGQCVDVSLLDSAVAQIEADVPYYGMTGDLLPRMGNRRMYSAPANSFKASNGYVYIAPGADSLWRRLCKAMGRPELGEHPDYRGSKDRLAHAEAVDQLVAEWASTRTVNEIIETLTAAEVPCGAVNDIAAMMIDPQVMARDMIVKARHPTLGEMPVPGQPIKMSKTPPTPGRELAEPGQHNSEVYGGLLGHSGKQIAEWVKAGVI